MRLVSFLEIYVLYREFLGGPVGGLNAFNRYVVPTFAADLRIFKKMITNIFSKAGVSGQVSSQHLVAAGVLVPQLSVQFGLCHDLSVRAVQLLIKFVGTRQITCAQGFSKPYYQ